MSLTLSQISHAYSLGREGKRELMTQALREVDFEVAAGELVLVLGTTGSGKSTLMRLASGLMPLQSGTANIDGAPLDSSTARGAVGMCFQSAESQLFAESVLEDAAFGPRNLGVEAAEADEAARDALEAVGLPVREYGSRSPFGLSGGEARRAALAGVLAMQPRYLTLDEPTAGLDAPGRALVREAIRRARAHAGVAVVTHDPGEFLGEADRVLVLDAGAARFWGAACEILADPAPLEAAGLEVPALLAVQRLARERGLDAGPPSLDVAQVAQALARAGGWVT